MSSKVPPSLVSRNWVSVRVTDFLPKNVRFAARYATPRPHGTSVQADHLWCYAHGTFWHCPTVLQLVTVDYC